MGHTKRRSCRLVNKYTLGFDFVGKCEKVPIGCFWGPHGHPREWQHGSSHSWSLLIFWVQLQSINHIYVSVFWRVISDSIFSCLVSFDIKMNSEYNLVWSFPSYSSLITWQETWIFFLAQILYGAGHGTTVSP